MFKLIKNILNGAKQTITISTDNNSFSYQSNNSSITINGDKITFNDQSIDLTGKEIHINIEGSTGNIQVGTCSTITINGDVHGKVDISAGDLTCGNVTGNVKASCGDVTCGNVQGDAKVSCGDLHMRRG